MRSDPSRPAVKAVLFDLDGTLVDTLPDLAAAANRTLREQGIDALPEACYRGVVSRGGAAMLELGLCSRDEVAMEPLLRRFIAHYRDRIAARTRPFPGIEALLETLERRALGWGIVTNKRRSLAEPLMVALGLSERAGCLVCGDTTEHAKPHPQPLLHACREIGVAPGEALFVGDSVDDVSAGRRAGVCTLVALYGYIPNDADPTAWGAQGLIDRPAEVVRWLGG